jgi:hypothetical protein
MAVLLSLLFLASVQCSPSPLADPRDADHYFDTRELWGRRRGISHPVNLPTALKVRIHFCTNHQKLNLPRYKIK